MKKYLLTLLVLVSSLALSAQGADSLQLSTDGEFSGKPIVTIFANHHTALSDNTSGSGFGLDRVYLGYGFKFKNEISGSVVFDVASSGVDGADLDYVAHIKNAFLTWKRDDLEVNFGMIKTTNFGYQEKAWGYRYLMKSFKDEYGFAPSADLGVSAKYKATSWLDVDISITNGEGNKVVDVDNNYRYGVGATFKATKELSFRAYYDLYTATDIDAGVEKDPQHTFTIFAGYKHSLFSVGGEYIYRLNMDYNKDMNYNGISIFSTVKLLDKLSVFGRYDSLAANIKSADGVGSAIRAGIEYTPYRYLKFSPNISSWTPEKGDSEVYIYLNMLFKF